MTQISSNVCYTLTFGDCAENHIGMQKYGEEKEAFSCKEIEDIYKHLIKNNIKCELIKLNDLIETNVEQAYFLIIRDGLNHIKQNSDKEIFEELSNINFDKKYYDTRRNKILNKIARHNIIFHNYSKEPNYENKEGRIISFDTVPILKYVRKNLSKFLLNEKANNLLVEGNKYYDVNKCSIGLHGDGERNITIGMRFGCPFAIAFQWFCQSTKIGKPFISILNSGDIYIMSKKTVGKDWKKKIYLL